MLCVEDNPYGRVVLNTVLGELGHQVSFAETGEAAVAAVARRRLRRRADGRRAARHRRLRDRAAHPRAAGSAGAIPIIGVSGRTDDEDEAAACDAGMNSYLRKPASPATLNAALAAVAVAEAEKTVMIDLRELIGACCGVVSRCAIAASAQTPAYITAKPDAAVRAFGNDVARKIFSDAYTPARQQAVLRSQKAIPGFDCPADPQIALAAGHPVIR